MSPQPFVNRAAGNPDEDTRKLLARALRPFLLRPTKEQVVRELPPKVEQTRYCELDARNAGSTTNCLTITARRL
jgi:SNF2 family DNA or RNA helicase